MTKPTTNKKTSSNKRKIGDLCEREREMLEAFKEQVVERKKRPRKKVKPVVPTPPPDRRSVPAAQAAAAAASTPTQAATKKAANKSKSRRKSSAAPSRSEDDGSEMEDAKPASASRRRRSPRGSRGNDDDDDESMSSSSGSSDDEEEPVVEQAAPKRRKKGGGSPVIPPPAAAPAAKPRSRTTTKKPRASEPARPSRQSFPARRSTTNQRPRASTARRSSLPATQPTAVEIAKVYYNELEEQKRARQQEQPSADEAVAPRRDLDRTPQRRNHQNNLPFGSPQPRVPQPKPRQVEDSEEDESSEGDYDHQNIADEQDDVVHGETQDSGRIFSMKFFQGFSMIICVLVAAMVFGMVHPPTLPASTTTTVTTNTRPCFRDFPERALLPPKVADDANDDDDGPSGLWWAPHCQDVSSSSSVWKPCPENARCVGGVVSSCLVDHLTVVNETECVLSPTALQTIEMMRKLTANYSVALLCGGHLGPKNPYYVKHHCDDHADRPLFDYAAIARVLQRPSSDRQLLELANKKLSPTFLVVENSHDHDQILVGLHPHIPLDVPFQCWAKNAASEATMAFFGILWMAFLFVGFYVWDAFVEAPGTSAVLLSGAFILSKWALKKYRTKKLRLEVANLRHRACAALENYPGAVQADGRFSRAMHADALIDGILDADHPLNRKRRRYLKVVIWPCVLHDWATDNRIKQWTTQNDDELVVEWRRVDNNNNHHNHGNGGQRVRFQE